MGDYPDRVENIYCKNCGYVTEHNIYIKTRRETEKQTVYGELFQYDKTIAIHDYETTTQVCTICGKTKTETSEVGCCNII